MLRALNIRTLYKKKWISKKSLVATLRSAGVRVCALPSIPFILVVVCVSYFVSNTFSVCPFNVSLSHTSLTLGHHTQLMNFASSKSNGIPSDCIDDSSILDIRRIFLYENMCNRKMNTDPTNRGLLCNINIIINNNNYHEYFIRDTFFPFNYIFSL